MSIDTETKRRSVLGYSNAPVYPVPDSTIAEGDRAHVAWLYSGMDYTEPAAVTAYRTLVAKLRPFTVTAQKR